MDLRLKEVLDEKNMSLVSLSEKTGIEKGNLSAIANNKKNPTVETLSKIANALEISITELFEKPYNGLYGVCPHCGKNVIMVLKKEEDD